MTESHKPVLPEKTNLPRLPQVRERWWARKTTDEEIEYTRQNACFTTISRLRRALLANLGIERKNKTSENIIVFSCVGLFSQIRHTVHYIKILDRLGVHYTYLPEEDCCGWPIVELTEGEERRKAELASRELIGMNIARARELGAKRMYYCCVWCVHLARALFPNCDVQQKYFLDILSDKLDGLDLHVKPQTVGYFEGCHKRSRVLTPGVEIDWPAYGRMLEKIQGLDVVQLTHQTCCVQGHDRIVDEARGKGLNTIVNSCTACQTWLEPAGVSKPGSTGKVQAKMVTDLLLEAMAPELVLPI